MTRARAKRFKKTLNILIRDAQVEETHVFNFKEEIKMVHVIKVNPNLNQEPRHLTCWFVAILELICCRFGVDLLPIW